MIEATPKLIHPLLQKLYLDEIYRKIKKENYSEELHFEQMLITDNLGRNELFLIDRQVTDKELRGKRLDLLALNQIQANKYQFLILEVKMGINSELSDKVADQLTGYIEHIENHFTDYKYCYEKQYAQKKEFGIIDIPESETINIVPGVRGMVIVGGYSGIAKDQITLLQKKYPNLIVQQFKYKIKPVN